MLRKWICITAVNSFNHLQLIYFTLHLFLTKKKKIVFLDIDNTLADTWPTLLPEFILTSERERLLNLKPLLGSIGYVQGKFTSDFLRVYLTHRPLQSSAITKRWLLENRIRNKGDLLFLVSSPMDKLIYIGKAIDSKKFSSIFVVDDLSHSHEHGEVKYYKNIIDELLKREVHYVGYEEILRLNRNG